jgi:hypothetical protein
MELLALDPPAHGVNMTGIYIIDDDGIQVCAGPFHSETEALFWIEERQVRFAKQTYPRDRGRE